MAYISSKLTEEERSYLKSLQRSPVWVSILTKLKTYRALPLYKPGKKDQNYDLWVYESGLCRERQGLLSIFSQDSETQIILKEDKQ